MPLAVYVIGLSVFALGTSEFMLSGLLPALAGDLGVSIPDAGLLISAFAVGMVVGAPVLAMATVRLPPRTTMIGLIVVFGLGQVLGALSPGYGVLFASRVVSALACAGFWAVGAATAVRLAPQGAQARALAVVVGGLTIANIVGVPAGTVIGQLAGWRAAFWAVAALSAVAAVGLVALVPASPREAEPPRLAEELHIYGKPRVWLALGTIALTQAAIFCTFSYLAPLLTESAGLPAAWVPGVLALFGIGALVGISLGGRSADARPRPTLLIGIAATLLVTALLALAAHSPLLVVPLIALFGVAGFGVNPALNARVFAASGGANSMTGAASTAAFNVGNTAGPWLGGLAIGGGLGYPSVAWVSALLGLLALGSVAVTSKRSVILAS
ncbi:MFS transporter [Kutzneria viridogrisea]|uniref:DHA1 family chloramphenicol resistance protein-like MFS transporter n=2 Tax=Kutzneria TaxID=43356 RepID=A0ABR6BPI7_9PSEU|nr:Cmx/CmrA family chloramphenicol efflux MFS transporter [Kutzneria albida]AHH96008.1 putative transmembrane efflux protein (MFS) [Kutzneria albida DSM 43870]MBA8928790.1 DHA1 family chloramphenicol resistance protein-like MFS transporter [Kutzneria viridogrisea]